MDDCLDFIDFGEFKNNKSLNKENFGMISEAIFPSFNLKEEEGGVQKFLENFYSTSIIKDNKIPFMRPNSKKFVSELNLNQLEFIHKKSPLVWNEYHVGVWLKTEGFEEYNKIFFEKGIDGKKIIEMTESDLSNLGVQKNRRKLFLKIISLKRTKSNKRGSCAMDRANLFN
jgi:hypothetical protein